MNKNLTVLPVRCRVVCEREGERLGLCLSPSTVRTGGGPVSWGSRRHRTWGAAVGVSAEAYLRK